MRWRLLVRYLTMFVAVCLAAPAYGQAGSVAAAVERRIAKRFAQGAGTAAMSAAERQALAKLWVELDRKTLAAIERRYGSSISAESLRQASKSTATVMDRATFEAHLRQKFPEMTASERQNLLGYYFEQQVTISGNQVQLPLTMAHERLHQLSHPRFREELGSRLDEGVTEMLAKAIHGDLAIAGSPKVYFDEQRIATMLGARLGEKKMAEAYFKGNVGALQRELDGQLGAGSFNRLASAIRAGDLGRAEALLR